MKRQSKILDPELVRSLSFDQCTNQDIADICGTSLEQREEAFGPVLTRSRALGRAQLRSAMFKLASSGEAKGAAVSIWLSKQYLGMRDPRDDLTDAEKLDIVEIVDYSKVGV